MAKIPLTISPDYCAGWSVWEGCREIISNAKDAEDEDPVHTMDIQHFPRTSRLVIRTRDIVIDPAALLVLGKSSKAGADVRGRFGEGFAIGCLALTRAGHEVTFANGEARWKCTLERADDDHPFAGSELLTFWSRAASKTEDFEVTIDNITAEVWEAMRKLFLFLTPPAAALKLAVSGGSVLLEPERKGQVFARGVFVRAFEDLQAGYDLKSLELDRDRRMVDEWRLHGQLCDLWSEIVREKPEAMAKTVYEMAKVDAPEVGPLRWRSDDKLVKAMRKEFEEEHGESAVPVSTIAEAKEITALGAKPTVVNTMLKELLAKAGKSVETAKTSLEGAVATRLNLDDLTAEEVSALCYVETYAKAYVVVEFRGATTLVKPLDENKVLGVDRRLLGQDMRVIMLHVVNGEARRRNVNATDVLLDAMIAVLRLDEADVPAAEPEKAYASSDEAPDLPF